MMDFKYSINLAWSSEDKAYIATIPEFPGLSAFGETPEVAVSEVKVAAEGFIEVYLEDGQPLPEPKIKQSFSGQTRIRLPKSLHAALSGQAQSEGVSLNTYLVSLLSERNPAKKLENQIKSLRNAIYSGRFQTGPDISAMSSSFQLITWDLNENKPLH